VKQISQFSYLYIMQASDNNMTIIEGYFRLLENLTPSNKLDLISKLTDSVKSDLKDTKPSFKNSFGAFQSDKDADQIINEIHSSRTFTRQTEDI
jgi:hypothetical protein